MNEQRIFSRQQAKVFVESRVGLAFEVQCQVCGETGPRSLKLGLVNNWLLRHPCPRSRYKVQVTGKVPPRIKEIVDGKPVYVRSTRLTLRMIERFAQAFWVEWAEGDKNWEQELKRRFRFLPGSVGWKIAAWLRAVAKATDGGGERDLLAYKTCVMCGKDIRIKRKPRPRAPRRPLLPRPPTCGSASCRVRLWRKMHPMEYNEYQAKLMASRRKRTPSVPDRE